MLVSFTVQSLQHIHYALDRRLGGPSERMIEAAPAQGPRHAFHRGARVPPTARSPPAPTAPPPAAGAAGQPDHLGLRPDLPAAQAGAPRRRPLHPVGARVTSSGP